MIGQVDVNAIVLVVQMNTNVDIFSLNSPINFPIMLDMTTNSYHPIDFQ
jgi:hypothetical protein